MRSRVGWLLAPILGFYVVTYFPAMAGFITVSLHTYQGMGVVGEGWTLAQYARVLTDPFYGRAMLVTMQMAATATFLSLLLSYPLAYFIVRRHSRIATLVFTAVVASAYTSAVVRTLGWKMLLGLNGPVNQFLLATGFISAPLKLTDNLTGAVIGLTHIYIPLLTLLLAAVIHNIHPSLEEAAASMGASSWQTFWRVLLPLSLPGVIGGTLLVFALNMGAFTTPALLGGGRLPALSILIRESVISTLNLPMGAALSSLLLLVVMGTYWATTAVTRGEAYR